MSSLSFIFLISLNKLTPSLAWVLYLRPWACCKYNASHFTAGHVLTHMSCIASQIALYYKLFISHATCPNSMDSFFHQVIYHADIQDARMRPFKAFQLFSFYDHCLHRERLFLFIYL